MKTLLTKNSFSNFGTVGTASLFVILSLSLSLILPLEARASDWTIWQPPTVYYDFDGVDRITYVKDRVGNNDLTLTAMQGASAYIQNAEAFFYGAQYGVANDSAAFSQTGSFSIEAWVRFNSISSEPNIIQTVLAKWDETSDDRSYRLIIQTDSTGRTFPKFQISNDGTAGNIKTVTGKTQILPRIKYLLQGYYDAGAGTVYIYVNGVQEASTGSVGASITDEPSNFYLGATKKDSSTYDSFLNGTIDELRLFSGTRSEGSFAYSKRRGEPVAKIPFDDASGVQAFDNSYYDNRGALVNFPTNNSQWQPGFYNYALQFDGTNDYVDLGSNNSLQLGKAITISTWINLSSLGNYTIVSQPHTSGYTFALTSAGEMTFGALGGTTVTSSGAGISANNWTHIAVAYDGSKVYFYKDGRVISSGSLPLWSVVTGGVFVGKAGSTPNYFSGKMDNLLIYPYNRTLFEVYADLNQGAIVLGRRQELRPANAEMACPTGYVWIPGDPLFGTNDFCVMKYEAKCDVDKDGVGETAAGAYAACNTTYDTWGNILSGCRCETDKGGQIVSSAAGHPLARIAQDDGTSDDAKSYCESIGAHLITNAEWMTIARNTERMGSDWCDLNGGGCGFSPGQSSKYLVAGHNDNVPALGLQASTDDSQACYGTVTKDVNTACGSAGTQKRTHTLSNGQTIWDLAGNLWGWTDDTVLRKDEPDSETSGVPDVGWGWTDFAAGSLTRILVNNGQGSSMDYDVFRPSNSSWNANQRVGRIYIYSDVNDTNTTVYAFRRGAHWGYTTDAGVFTLCLHDTPGDTGDGGLGFRCAVAP